MKKITLLLIGGTFLFVGYKNLPSGSENPPGTMSNGAPAASTGAPDEMHCSNTGCHSDFAPNTGTAQLTASVGNEITSYEPGKTYPVTVSITDPGRVRFGFQAVALNAENKNAGSIKITDEPRTQIVPGYGSQSDRKYVTYTYEGTNAVQTGLGKWSFEWTAPQINEGVVTLYFGSVAANNDGTDAGDYTYSARIMIEAPPPPAISWSVYPNLSSSLFSVQCSGMSIDLKIFNAAGEKVFEKTNLETGTQGVELNQPSGVYFISAVQNGKTSMQKIIITK